MKEQRQHGIITSSSHFVVNHLVTCNFGLLKLFRVEGIHPDYVELDSHERRPFSPLLESLYSQ